MSSELYFEIKEVKDLNAVMKKQNSWKWPLPTYKIEEFRPIAGNPNAMEAVLRLVNISDFLSRLRQPDRVTPMFHVSKNLNRYPLSHFLYESWKGNIDYKDVILVQDTVTYGRRVIYNLYRKI